METFYFDAGLKGTSTTTIKSARTSEASDSFKSGDIVETWNHVFRWDDDCIPHQQMTTWRTRGDTLADAALPILAGPAGDAGGTDLLARLEAATTQPAAEPAVMALWHQLHSVGKQSDIKWPSREQIGRGQAVFYRYAPQILASLLHFSLAGGFSSPRISRVLNIASYLVPPMSSTPEGEAPMISDKSSNRSYLRLMETTQFVVDCMAKDSLEVGGTGWSAAVRVRLLHATMRKRVLEKSRREWETIGASEYDERRDGIPISQEDMAGTLSAFGAAPLVNLLKVGISPSPQECEDHAALWRVIGYFLGIDQDILQDHFSDWHKAQRLLACAMLDVFAEETQPPPPNQFPLEGHLVPITRQVRYKTPSDTNGDPYTSPATLPVLFSMSGRWPLPFNFALQCAASRQLLLPSLSDWLSIPETSWTQALSLRIGFGLANIPARFAQIYRPGWDTKRRNVMQRDVEAAVALALGERHSKFRSRALDAYTPTKEGDEFDGFVDFGIIKTSFNGWVLLYAEMTAALISPAIVVGVAWLCWRRS